MGTWQTFKSAASHSRASKQKEKSTTKHSVNEKQTFFSSSSVGSRRQSVYTKDGACRSVCSTASLCNQCFLTWRILCCFINIYITKISLLWLLLIQIFLLLYADKTCNRHVKHRHRSLFDMYGCRRSQTGTKISFSLFPHYIVKWLCSWSSTQPGAREILIILKVMSSTLNHRKMMFILLVESLKAQCKTR